MKLAKGFIMNKMYTLGYIGGRHTSPDNLPRSCPPELEKWVRAAVEQLRQEGLLIIKPTGYGDQASAVMTDHGREYANAYKRSVNLPEADFSPPRQQRKVPPLTDEQLRKLKFRKKNRSSRAETMISVSPRKKEKEGK